MVLRLRDRRARLRRLPMLHRLRLVLHRPLAVLLYARQHGLPVRPLRAPANRRLLPTDVSRSRMRAA